VGLIASGVALSRRVSSVLKLLLQAREPAGREPSPSAGDTRLRHRGIGFAHDSLLEGTGFELLVRGRVKLVVGRGRQRNWTARRSRLSMRIGDLRSARTPHQGRRARISLCSTVGPRTAPRGPFHRSRDRARYRYYEGSRSGPAV